MSNINLKTKMTTFVQGILMGIVEVIPGVSGSTLALIMGIYDDFINFLHLLSEIMKQVVKVLAGKLSPAEFIKYLKSQSYGFGITLVFGMLFGIGAFSHVMSYLLEHKPVYTFAFFFALILGSIRVPLNQVSLKRSSALASMILVAGLFYYVLGLNPATTNTNPSLVMTFFSGFLAICAMVLPGISGSFVLLLLGMYDFVIELIKNVTKFNVTSHELIILGTLLLGIVLGFALFVRVIKYVLKKFPQELMAGLAGLMVASLRVLWPFNTTRIQADANIFVTIFIIIATFSVVTLINQRAKS